MALKPVSNEKAEKHSVKLAPKKRLETYDLSV